MRTALICHPGVTWRAWLKANRSASDLLCLDPGDSIQPRPAQLTLLKGTKVKNWRFYGSLDPNRAPHVLVAAMTQLIAEASPDVLIQFPAHRSSPLAHQTTLLLAETLRPDRILLGQGTELDSNALPIGPESIELEPAFPHLVETAQRKARWLGFMDGATSQTLSLSRLCLEGARLGSGRPVSREQLRKSLPVALHAEVNGSALFVVSDAPLEDEDAGRALNTFHCARLLTALQSDYTGLLCSLARGTNQDFAFGIIEAIDFAAGEVRILSDAVPPAPATLLRLGSLRLDPKGNELGETKPWVL